VVGVFCCLSIQAIEVLLNKIFIGKVSRFGLKLSGISVLEPQRLVGLGVGMYLVCPSVAVRYDCETLGWGGKCHRHEGVLSGLVVSETGENRHTMYGYIQHMHVLFFCNYPGGGGLDKSLDKYKLMILK
jgi:hypothetical protein